MYVVAYFCSFDLIRCGEKDMEREVYLNTSEIDEPERVKGSGL